MLAISAVKESCTIPSASLILSSKYRALQASFFLPSYSWFGSCQLFSPSIKLRQFKIDIGLFLYMPQFHAFLFLAWTIFLPSLIASSFSIGPPKNCVNAPTSHSSLRRDTLYTVWKALINRGNPICYYLESTVSNLISTTAPSLEFVIPAGIWAVRWELERSRGRYPAVDGITHVL